MSDHPCRKAGNRQAILRAARSLAGRIWYPETGAGAGRFLAALSRPAAGLYLACLRLHQASMRRRSARLPAFVLSIGNIVAGGTGKTPLALWTAGFLRDLGLQPAILSRGYGRVGKGTARVPIAPDCAHLTERFGDEPVLMARKLPSVPVWVGKRRFLSGQKAIEADGAQVLVLDDGFQHLALERDLDLVVLDGDSPFGNGLLLPLGPLREPAVHLRRAGALIVCRGEEPQRPHHAEIPLQDMFPGKPVFTATRRLGPFRVGLGGPEIPIGRLAQSRTLAFAGIARPERFFNALRQAGANLVAKAPFPDHYRYTEADAACLLDRARTHRATCLVTTEKDAVKLPAELKEVVVTAELTLDFGPDLSRLSNFLETRLKAIIPPSAR